jgi:RNA polymerase sigma-70 factor (sigma-E family)
LVQSALVQVYLGWSRLRDGNPEAYARTVITHAHTDWWRRKPWREVSTMTPPPRPSGADIAADLARRDSIMRALSSLTPRERAVIVLRFYCDQAEADIARELGCPIGTVKSTTARAVAKLKKNRNLISEVMGT